MNLRFSFRNDKIIIAMIIISTIIITIIIITIIYISIIIIITILTNIIIITIIIITIIITIITITIIVITINSSAIIIITIIIITLGMINREGRLVDSADVSSARLDQLAGFQAKLLKHALSFPRVKKVVYSTCSIFPEENERVVFEVLQQVADKFVIKNILPHITRRGMEKFSLSNGNEIVFEDGQKCIRLSPITDLTNGFFVACFQRLKRKSVGCNNVVENPLQSVHNGKKRKCLCEESQETSNYAPHVNEHMTEPGNVDNSNGDDEVQQEKKCIKKRKKSAKMSHEFLCNEEQNSANASICENTSVYYENKGTDICNDKIIIAKKKKKQIKLDNKEIK